MKAADTARQAMTPLLNPGETLRSVGNLVSGPFWAMMLVSNLFAFALKYWYAGVTEQRLILVQLNAWGKPNLEKTYNIRLDGVEVAGNNLVLTLPGEAKPKKFRAYMGLKALTGFDWQEFRAALGR